VGPLPPPSQGIPPGAMVMKSKHDFARIQEPVTYPKGAGPEIENISDIGNGIVRFRLRVEKNWRDGDGAAGEKGGGKVADRQRAECRSLGGKGVYQKPGELWEYGTTVRTSPNFRVYGSKGGWRDVQQLKEYSSVDGKDTGMPLIKITIDRGSSAGKLAIKAYSPAGGGRGELVAGTFEFTPGDWIIVKWRVKTGSDGLFQVSFNNGPFQGKTGVKMQGNGASAWDLKVGLYRKLVMPDMIGDDSYIDHKDTYRVRLP
jgi:hypothetical protein